MTLNDKPFEVLIVDDNVPDVELLKFLFSNCPRKTHLSCAYDGTEASDFLFKRNKSAVGPTPDLVLLDLNLPRKDGREVLREIKADKDLGKIPVIMLSTSSSQREITEAYSLGAAAFITKPADLEDFQSVIRALTEFWFSQVHLPTRLSGSD